MHRILLGFLLLAIVLHQDAFAAGSGGLRVETPDAGAFGKGSAFAGEANRASAVYYNPAGLTQLKQNEVAVGFAMIAPQADFESPSGEETQMRRNIFIIPHFYAGVPLGESKFVLGLGASSYWGTGTDWAPDSFSRYVATESEMENKDVMLTLAYPLTSQWSVALSADVDDAKASLNKKLFQAGTGDDAGFQLKAKSRAAGYRLATHYKFNDRHQAGLMYRSTLRHKFRGKAYLDNLNNAGTYPYQAIFGGSYYETELSEEYVFPQSVIAGYSFKPNTKWTFNLDVEWFDWSSVEQELISWEDETDATRLGILNNGNPASRDWRSVFSQAMGFEYAMREDLRVRGGYYHHAPPIPKSNLDSSLPDTETHGITTGFGYDMNPNFTVDMAYSAIIYKPVKIDNNIGAASGGSVNGTYRQFNNLFLATATYRF